MLNYLLRKHMTEINRSWREVGANAECDTGAGEVYRKDSPGKGSSLAQCKDSCAEAPGCRSITYFGASGWCSHFSTACTKTKSKRKAMSLRLSSDVDMRTTARTPRRWVHVSKTVVCDTNAGEV